MSAQVIHTFTRVVAWTAGFLGQMVASACGAQRVIPPRSACGELRLAILGRSRHQIASILGVPPTASIGFGMRLSPNAPATFWQASTWYYPFDPHQHKALAIRFVGNRAREVEFIGTPQNP